MAFERDQSAGVSYRDVETAVRELMKSHCCNCVWELSYPVGEGTSVLMWVTLLATPRIVGRRTIRGATRVSRRWPHVDHRTLPGAQLWLVGEMDRMLEEAGHVAAEQAALDW